MSNIYVCLCEGDHDIAYLARVIQSCGYSLYEKKITDIKKPLNNIFTNILKESTISDRKIGFHPNPTLLPYAAFNDDEVIIFLHNMKGCSSKIERDLVLKQYNDMKSNDDFSKDLGFSTDFSFRFLYFFDADLLGVDKRLSDFIIEVGKDGYNPKNGEIFPHAGNEFGCYVFHDLENIKKHGDLEDILLALLRPTESELYLAIDSFISENEGKIPPKRRREFTVREGREDYKGTEKYKRKKSFISAFGLFQFSGSNNSVFINKTDMISHEKLKNCEHGKILMKMFTT